MTRERRRRRKEERISIFGLGGGGKITLAVQPLRCFGLLEVGVQGKVDYLEALVNQIRGCGYCILGRGVVVRGRH